MTYQELYQFGISELKDAKIEDAAYDARELLLGISGLSRYSLTNSIKQEVSQPVEDSYRHCIARRKQHYPLQYLLSEWEFYGLTLKVGEGVLIPRPETEMLVDFSLDFLKEKEEPAPVVWDLCAGSGCIGLAIAANCPGCGVFSLEKSEKAFSYLQQNIQLCGLSGRVTPVLGDLRDGPQMLFAKGSENPTVIVSNPPYILQSELPKLQEEVRFEPSMALDGGEDGMLFYRILAEQWLPSLKKGGLAVFECGEEQGEALSCLFSQDGRTVKPFQDYAGLPRGVVIRT